MMTGLSCFSMATTTESSLFTTSRYLRGRVMGERCGERLTIVIMHSNSKIHLIVTLIPSVLSLKVVRVWKTQKKRRKKRKYERKDPKIY